MSKAWIDDAVQREPWVRSCGPIATLLYIFGTNLIHRRALDEHVLTRQELRDEFPWEIDDQEFDRALQRLEARERVVLHGGFVEFVLYGSEQESNAARRDRAATNARVAREAWASRKKGKDGRILPTGTRDAGGDLRRVCDTEEPAMGAESDRVDNSPDRSESLRDAGGDLHRACDTQESAQVPPTSYPIRSYPVLSDPEDSAPSERAALAALEPRTSIPVATVSRAPASLREVTGSSGDLVGECLAWIAAKPPETDVHRVWQFYVLRYVVAEGAKPTQKAEYFVNLTRLVGEHKAEGVIGKLNSYFDSPRFPYAGGARDLSRFIKYFDQIPAAKESAIARQVGFEEVGRRFLAANSGSHATLPMEILDFMRGPSREAAF